jgi:AhpC/TSA family
MRHKLSLFLIGVGLAHFMVPLVWLLLANKPVSDPILLWWIISAVSGLGLLGTALAPYRYWPVWLLVGQQKLGWLLYWATSWQNLPLPFYLWEVGWLCCLVAMLAHTYKRFLQPPRSLPDWRSLLFDTYALGKRYNLGDKQQHQPLLLFFTRHSGCTFCREMLDELNTHIHRQQLPASLVVIITQSDPSSVEHMQLDYPYLAQVDWVSDPHRQLYQAFRLKRGRLGQMFGWRVWWRGLQANRHGVGFLEGDGFQMPGVVLVRQGSIMAQQVFETAADKVDWPGWLQRTHDLYS